jgi:hypothetical protein
MEGLRPIFFGPCTPGRTWGTRPVSSTSRLTRQSQVEGSGIPHLAKNERDVGHPGLVAGKELSRGHSAAQRHTLRPAISMVAQEAPRTSPSAWTAIGGS